MAVLGVEGAGPGVAVWRVGGAGFRAVTGGQTAVAAGQCTSVCPCTPAGDILRRRGQLLITVNNRWTTCSYGKTVAMYIQAHCVI